MFKKKTLLHSIVFMLFIDSIGGGLIFPILPELFLNDQSGLIVNTSSYLSRETLFGISLALFPLSSIFGMPTFGAISDVYGKSKIILYGLSALTLTYLLSVVSILIHNLQLFLICRLLSGFLSGTYSVGNALINCIDDDDDKRISNFKLSTFASMLGFILGPGLSTFTDKLPITNPLIMPFVIAFLLGILNLILLWYNFNNPIIKNLDYISSFNFNNREKILFFNFKPKHISILLSKLKSLFYLLIYVFNNQYTKTLGIAYFFAQFACGLFIQSLSLYLAIEYNYTPSQVAQFFIIMTISMFISMYVLQKLVTKYINYKIQIQIGLIILSILLMFGVILNKSTSSFLQFNYLSITYIVSITFYILLPFISLGFTNLFANSVGKEDQGKVMGGNGQISSIAMFVSGLIIGKLITKYNLILLTSGLSLILSYLILRRYLNVNNC